MNVVVEKSNTLGAVFSPPSKSYAHRLLISAFLSKLECTVENIEFSNDVLATLNVIKSMGANYKVDGSSINFYPPVIPEKENLIFDAGESGSTLRFCLPICCALGLDGTFKTAGRLADRPISKLVNCLNENGAKVSGFTASGKLKTGDYFIDATESSQYISGLMFALSILDGESKIILKGKKTSVQYISLTIDALSRFGIKIIETDYGYKVLGNTFISPKKVAVEGDYSNGAFLLSLGAINGKISVSGLNKNSLQGDSKIVEILQDFGANIKWQGDVIVVEKSTLTGVEVDVQNIPDLAQIISVVGAFAKGKTILKNVERLRLKESDRIGGILATLKSAGVEVYENGNQITIVGGNASSGVFDSQNDHRTCMSATVLALSVDGVSTILGAQAVNKSYPTFFKVIKSIGGKVNGDL